MSFELVVLLTFPRHVFHIAPPLPVRLEHGARATSEIGQVVFYFDDWDEPERNVTGGDPVIVDTFFAHFVPSIVPPELVRALTVPEHPYACVLYRSGSPESDDPDDGEEEPGHPEWAEQGEAAELTDAGEWAEARLADIESSHARHLRDRLFADPVLGRYLDRVGDHMRTAIRTFLTILKAEYGQYLVPDGFPITTGRNHWGLAGGAVRPVADIFIDRLLGFRSWADAGDLNTVIEPHHWAQLTARLDADRPPPLLEVLLASAKGECDPDLGNPRLALMEAVGALEAEIQKLVTLRLQRYGIGRAEANGIVRRTALEDLITAWTRHRLRRRAEPVDQALHYRCTEALRVHRDIARHGGRDLAPGRAREYVEALGRLARLARGARTGERPES